MTLAIPGGAAPLPAVFAGMDRTAALAHFARMLDAAEAGATLWDDAETVSRFLAGCSRTGSAGTRAGYRLDLQRLADWIGTHHPGLRLRDFAPHHAQAYVDDLRAQAEAGHFSRSTFNRRISTVSALFNWCADPNRAGVTGIARNPMPRRVLLEVPRRGRALTEAELSAVLGTVESAARAGHRTAMRDAVLLRATYLIGARVSEVVALRWQDVEAVEGGGLVHLMHCKGGRPRVVRVSGETLALFESLGRGKPDQWLFPNPKGTSHISRQAVYDRCRRWGMKVGQHLHPHRLRHSHATHAVQRGVDAFTLQSTLGHRSTSTTAHYVSSNPADSSSLRLG